MHTFYFYIYENAKIEIRLCFPARHVSYIQITTKSRDIIQSIVIIVFRSFFQTECTKNHFTYSKLLVHLVSSQNSFTVLSSTGEKRRAQRCTSVESIVNGAWEFTPSKSSADFRFYLWQNTPELPIVHEKAGNPDNVHPNNIHLACRT